MSFCKLCKTVKSYYFFIKPLLCVDTKTNVDIDSDTVLAICSIQQLSLQLLHTVSDKHVRRYTQHLISLSTVRRAYHGPSASATSRRPLRIANLCSRFAHHSRAKCPHSLRPRSPPHVSRVVLIFRKRNVKWSTKMFSLVFNRQFNLCVVWKAI